MIDNAANEPRQLDSGACSGDIGTKSGNDRLSATRNNVSRFGYRVVEIATMGAFSFD